MGSLTIKIFLKLQERICKRLNDFSELEKDKKEEFNRVGLNIGKTTFLKDHQIDKLHKFYRNNQLNLLQDIINDVNSFDNNIIKNRNFIDKMLVYVKRSKRYDDMRLLIRFLESFLSFCVGALHELEEITQEILSDKNAAHVLQYINHEHKIEKELKNRAIDLQLRINQQLNTISNNLEDNSEQIIKELKSTYIKFKKAGNTNFAILISINILAISTLLTACSTNGFSDKASAKNLENNISQMHSFVTNAPEVKVKQKTTIKVPKITFSGKVKLVNKSINTNTEVQSSNKTKIKSINFKQIMEKNSNDKYTQRFASSYHKKFITHAFNLNPEFILDSNLTNNELIVSRAIFYEAGNQSILGKLMVASTIYNSAKEKDTYHFAKEIFKSGRYESLPKIRINNGNGDNWEHSKRIAILMCRNKLNPDNYGFTFFLNKKIVEQDRGQSLPTFCYERIKVQKTIVKDGRTIDTWEWKYPKVKSNLRRGITIEDHTFYKEYNSNPKKISQEEYYRRY